MSEIRNGDPVKTFIIQVAALSWAATQVPEITVAIQRFLNAGFRSAVQVELLFMIGSLHPVTKATGAPSFRNFAPKCDFTCSDGGVHRSCPKVHAEENRWAKGKRAEDVHQGTVFGCLEPDGWHFYVQRRLHVVYTKESGAPIAGMWVPLAVKEFGPRLRLGERYE
jgi:hypothetical protein